jgi:hypothetical protein
MIDLLIYVDFQANKTYLGVEMSDFNESTTSIIALMHSIRQHSYEQAKINFRRDNLLITV